MACLWWPGGADLLVALALGQMSIMKWMFWVGLVITAADV
jgi:hypothetical protein